MSEDIIFVLPFILATLIGYLLNRMFLNRDTSFLLSPATGLSIVILVVHVLSVLDIKLSKSSIILSLVYISIIAIFFRKKQKTSIELIKLKRKDYIVLSLILLIALIPKILFYHYPSANSDPFFHSLKIRLIVDNKTLFFNPKEYPISLLTYPAGYHSLIVFGLLITTNKVYDIIRVMYGLEIYKWVLFPTGTFFASYALFKKKEIAYISAFLTTITPIYYEWQHFIVLPAHLNYYFYLILIGLYPIYLANPHKRLLFFITLYSFASLSVHLFQYYIFLVFVSTFIIGYLVKRDWNSVIKGIAPIMLALLLYLVLTSPISKYYSIKAIAFSNNLRKHFPSYKDTFLAFLYSFLKPNFWNSGSKILTLFFIIGFLRVTKQIIKERNLHLFALVSTPIFITFLIINKIVLGIPLPLFSIFYTAGRILILITPLVPIFAGVGMHLLTKILTHDRYRTIDIIIWIFLLVSLILVADYSLFLQYSNSVYHSQIEENSLNAFKWIDLNLPANSIFLNQGRLDGGQYITVLTRSRSLFNWINRDKYSSLLLYNWNEYFTNFSKNVDYVYIDSSKQICHIIYCDVLCSVLDVMQFYKTYQLVYFDRGIWIFNITSQNINRNFEKIREYYMLNYPYIDVGDIEFDKYLIYGWRIHTYDVVSTRIRKGKVLSLPIVQEKALVIFVPKKEYSTIRMKLLSLAEQNIMIKINNRRFNVNLKKGINEVNINTVFPHDRLNYIEFKILNSKNPICLDHSRWIYVYWIVFS